MFMGHSHKVDIGGVLAGSGQLLRVDDAVELQPFEGISFPEGARVHLDVRCVDRLLQIDGSVDTRLHGDCDACADPVDRDVRVTIEERLDPQDEGESDAFGTNNVLTGTRLDVADLAQQVVLSALPMGLRCRDDCAGLCAGCGANLNTSACSCSNGDHRGKPQVEDTTQ